MRKLIKMLFSKHDNSDYELACKKMENLKQKLTGIYFENVIVNNYKPIYITEIHL